MTQPNIRTSLLAARAHDRAALQAMALQHLPLVAMLVRRFRHGPWEVEELYQQGCVGLMKALLRFDPDQGVAFATYAVPVILGEMRHLTRLYAPIHVPRPEVEMRSRIRRTGDALAAALGHEPTINEVAAALRMDAAELALLTEEIAVVSTDAPAGDASPLMETLPDEDDWLCAVELRDLIDRLPPLDRQLLHLRFVQRMSQAETGQRLGLTQVQVSRRESVLRHQLYNAWYAT